MPKTTLSFYLHIIAVAVVVFAVGNWLSSRTPDRAEGSPSIISGDSSSASGLARNDNRESVFDRVMRTKTIRCAYVTYPPGLLKDPNTGALSGIFHDLVTEAARRMSLKIEWVEEVNFGNYIEGFETGRYDALCSSGWASAAQSPKVLYSIPLYYSGVGIYVRSDDNRFNDNFKILNNPNFKFSVTEGSLTQSIVATDFPKVQQGALPIQSDVSLILQDVAAQKADAAVSESYMANSFLAQNPGKLKNLVPNAPIRIFPNTFISPGNDLRFKLMMDGAFMELINSGLVENIVAQYEKWPGSLYRVARPYQLSAN
jgi:polar amino acid transport system substrate-binding protein